MGFMDKFKNAAQEVAVEAKKVTAQAQGKVEETQLKRKMDAAAKELGYLIHQERVKGVAAGPEADRLIASITSLEAEMARAAAETRAKQDAAHAQAPPDSTGYEPPSSSTPPTSTPPTSPER